MAGQGQEKETRSNTPARPHEACVQQQSKVKGRWGMLMWPPTTQGEVRDQLVTGQRDIWERAIIIRAAVVG